MLKHISGINGMALFTVLLLTAIMLLMTASMVFISTHQMSVMGNVSTKAKALKAAEAGIEYAIYMLDKDPAWGLASLNFDPNLTTFAPDYTAGAEVGLAPDTKFTITFSNSNSKYMSVNNLFQSDPTIASSTGVPCYTAKIISKGMCGSARKVLEAYLVRSDYYPNGINSEGSITLVAGSYMIRGSDPNLNHLTDPNLQPPGSIYSGWQPTPAPNAYGVDAYSGVKGIDLNGGSIIAKRKINLPAAMPTVYGNIKGNCPRNVYLSKIDVPAILDNASTGAYGGTNSYTSGLVKIMATPPAPVYPATGFFSSTLSMDDGGTGLSSACYIDSNTSIAKLILTQDIIINGNRVDVYNDRNKDLSDFAPMTPAPVANVLRIYPDASSYYKNIVYVTGWAPDPNGNICPVITPYPEVSNLSLDLNGHTIYSNSHLIIGMPVIGKGKIISYGKIYSLTGANNSQTIIISEQDNNLYASDRSYSTNNNGLYYAGDDLNIVPSLVLQPFYYKPTPEPNQITLRDTLEYPPGTTFVNPIPPTRKIGIGYYDPTLAQWWWDKGYSGNGMVATLTSSGGIILRSTGDQLQFNLEYLNKQFSISNAVIVMSISGSNVTATLHNSASTYPFLIEPNSLDPNSVGLSQSDLNLFGTEIVNTLNEASTGNNININAVLTSFNSNSASDPVNIENRSNIDTGSSNNTMILVHDPGYMKGILDLERKLFNVRVVACYEIE